jgi:hypothetical protein
MPAPTARTNPKPRSEPAAVFPYTLRKLLTLGHSYAVTVPADWARQHALLRGRYVACQQNADGTLTISPTPAPAARS